MTASLALRDVLLWSAQILALTGIAATLILVLRRSAPAIRLVFLQMTLAACLILPCLRIGREAVVSINVPSVVAPDTAITPHAPAQPAFRITTSEAALAAIVAGGLVRFLMMFAGFRRLRRYRLDSQPLPVSVTWSSEAEIRISSHVTGPVTFGFRKPVVLLPPDFTELREPMQDAILSHEILHIRRHDWLFTIGEEFVRAAFWFHPGIWWLLRRIQLAREEAVDREAVEMTRSRDAYIDALLVIAGASQYDLAPAPLFLRKRHLKQRIASILKESLMSRTKSISVLAAALAIVTAVGWFAGGALPMHAAPQMVTDAPGVSVDTHGAQLMHRQPVPYPPEAMTKGIQGTVVADANLDSGGNVTDAAIVSGPAELRKAVLQSLLTWHFTPASGVDSRDISVTFTALPALGGQVTVTARTPLAARDSQVQSIEVSGLYEQAQTELLNRIPVHTGDILTAEKYDQLVAAVRAFDAHLQVTAIPTEPNHSVIEIFAPGAPGRAPATGRIVAMAREQANAPQAATGSVPPPPAISGQSPAVPSPIQVGSTIAAANLTSQVAPVYPPLAKAAHVEGTVQFQATVGTDGSIKSLQVLSGPPLLIQAAMEAAKQWVYKPTLLNGSPVEVVTTIDINFTLDQ